MGSSENTAGPDGRTILSGEKHGEKHATKLVANAALSQATAIQKPRLLTKNMFLVCSTLFQTAKIYTNLVSALWLFACGNFQLMYQRLRRFSNGGYQFISPISDLFRLPRR